MFHVKSGSFSTINHFGILNVENVKRSLPLEFAWCMCMVLWFAAPASSRGGSSSSDLDFLDQPPPYHPGYGNPTYGTGHGSGFSGKC